MFVAEHPAVTQAAAVVDGGVVFLVANHIVVHPDDGGDDAEVALEARGEGHHRLFAEEIGEFLLEFLVNVEGAVQKAGARAPRTVRFQPLDARRDDFGVRSQPEVVVGADHDGALALDLHHGVLPRGEFVEVGVDARRPRHVIVVFFFGFFKKIDHGFFLSCVQFS